MLRFFYDTRYKYTNRTLIDVSGDTSYRDIDYLNIDSPDTINGHIIYRLESGENIPTYIVDRETGRRYFVSGITPLSANKKFQISLLRDVLSESDEWKDEEAYIDAGLATDFNKYKRWNLPFTNTKIKEQRLNFGGKSSFFVFYVNRQNISNDGEITSEEDYPVSSVTFPGMTVDEYLTVPNLNSILGYDYVGAGDIYLFDTEQATARIKIRKDGNPVRADVTRNIKTSQTSYSWANPININNVPVLDHTINMAGSYYRDIQLNTNSCRSQIGTALQNFSNSYKSSHYSTVGTSSKVNNLIDNYANRYIYNQADSKVYRISYTSDTFVQNEIINKNDTTTLTSALQNVNIPTYPDPIFGYTSTFEILDNGYCQVNYSGMYYNFTIEELGVGTSFDFNFKANVQKLPKSAVRCVNIVSGASSSVDDEVIAQALMLAQTTVTDLDNPMSDPDSLGQIIDIQYLPFSVATTASADIKINGSSQYATFLSNDDFQFFTNMSDLTDINKETDTINIVSPSRGSQFLFRPYDNNGNMEFTTSVTIKPFASTIYVRPSTKGLLQYDWQDKDCLVINEDFSLTKVSSSWADYVRQNRNYQRIFDRNLQSKAYERSWEREVEKVQARSDEYNAKLIANQAGRNLVGNIPIIGTAIGLISQGVSPMIGNSQYNNYMAAAQLDRQYNEAMYQESVSLAQDQFNMQLENIKSQPLIPTNITTIDCKLLDGVYLEFYSTNPTEKKAIEDFYKYNGNRIDTFGRFSDYYGWYVKGKIIRAVNYTQPEIDEINRRLGIGIFTEVQYD